MTDNSINHVISRLTENNLDYRLVNLAGDFSIVVTKRGARILGPFRGENGKSLSWLNSSFNSKDDFRDFLSTNNWNIGGERTWIAPESQYYVKDIDNPEKTWFCPEAIDPGNYTLTDYGNPGCRLTQEMVIDAYNFTPGRKKLHISKTILPVLDPLREISSYKSLAEGIVFAGYEQTVSLNEEHPDTIMSESWDLLQLPSGGRIFIPVNPLPEFSWYYKPSESKVHSIHSDFIELKLAKGIKYKTGYKAAHIKGRIGYLNTGHEGHPYLLIRNFFNNPSSCYLESPMECKKLHGGHSVHIYNDDGNLGNFGELECSGQTIGGSTGKKSAQDQYITWIYMGEMRRLREIGIHLLGVDITTGL